MQSPIIVHVRRKEAFAQQEQKKARASSRPLVVLIDNKKEKTQSPNIASAEG